MKKTYKLLLVTFFCVLLTGCPRWFGPRTPHIPRGPSLPGMFVSDINNNDPIIIDRTRNTSNS